jgi:ATP phosphoribosyltransferase regulatory subunit
MVTVEALRAEGTAAALDTTGMTEEELDAYAKAKGIETIMYMDGGEA